MAGNHAADHGRRDFLQRAGGGLVAALAAVPARARAQTTTASPLKIGMVGAGRMGGALGAVFVKAGHPVMFSSRHPENITGCPALTDRKSTRLNSSHTVISYAVFCLKKKKI